VDVRKGSVEDLEVSPAFWQGKRVFVTGHTGFKGSWLSLWLLRLGARVSGYAQAASTEPSLFSDAGLVHEIESTQADIRDRERLRASLHAQKPEIVIHMAAQAMVYESYQQPVETYATNVLGTANLLEALRTTAGVRVALIVTSDKCYRLDGGAERHVEEDALGGRDPYSASKACAEIVTAAYRASFFSAASANASGPAVASARAGNVIGGGDWAPHRLVPDAVAAFHQGGTLQLRNPQAIRPWQYVLDPLHGYLLLAQRLFTDASAFARAWNFGPPASHEISVEALIREFAEPWGAQARWQAVNEPGVYEAPALRLDSGRAQRELGWRARVPLAEALDATGSWYRAYFSGESAKSLVEAEIKRFERSRVT